MGGSVIAEPGAVTELSLITLPLVTGAPGTGQPVAVGSEA